MTPLKPQFRIRSCDCAERVFGARVNCLELKHRFMLHLVEFDLCRCSGGVDGELVDNLLHVGVSLGDNLVDLLGGVASVVDGECGRAVGEQCADE